MRKGRGQVLPEAHHNPKEGTLRRALLLVGLTVLGALLFAPVALAQDPCPDPKYPRGTLDGCLAVSR